MSKLATLFLGLGLIILSGCYEDHYNTTRVVPGPNYYNNHIGEPVPYHPYPNHPYAGHPVYPNHYPNHPIHSGPINHPHYNYNH